MKKRLTAALCSTLVVATALPALALTNEVTGFFRVRGILADLQKGKDMTPDSLVDQRFRAKWTLGVNEYVKVVYFGEVDFQWGDKSYTTARNDGGGIGGDTVNLETKNLYTELKVPNAPLSVTLGLQPYADNWDYTLLLADMAGAKFVTKINNIDANFGWFKLIEEGAQKKDAVAATVTPEVPATVLPGGTPGTADEEDDVTLWALQASMKPVEGAKVGADLYYVQNQGVEANQTGTSFRGYDEDLYYFGLNGSYKIPAAPATISGWLLYNFGTMEDAAVINGKTKDVDISAWAATLRGEMTAGPAKVAARVIYYSSDDDKADDSQESIRQPFAGTAPECVPFASDGLMLMLSDGQAATYPTLTANQAGAAIADAAWAGYGLLGFTVNGAFTPPDMKKLTLKGAAGYFMALEDDRSPKVTGNDREGTNIGAELAVRAAYMVADNFELSLHAAYAFLGDFYDKTVDKTTGVQKGAAAAGRDDPDSPYIVALQANVNF